MEIIKKLLLGPKVGSKHLVLAGNKDDNEANNERKRVAKELVEEGVK